MLPNYFKAYPKLKAFTLIEVMITGGILLVFINMFVQISNQTNSQIETVSDKLWISRNLDRWTTEVLWQHPYSKPLTAGVHQHTYNSEYGTADLVWRITEDHDELITVDFHIEDDYTKELSQYWIGTVLMD